ncbi:MAG TPA: 2-hydroxyacyl-CoA dehydratase family protein [Dehalococcoidia bacterium]|nr:2-hydroxyacyl-CoA dehydratase family protein [Dehalococcoidia bacterium]
METTVKSKVLQQFQEATETIVNPELKKWIEQGGKVVGHFCSYGPEEIITAAGMVPFRMRATGSRGTELADAYLSSINCSFCRHCYNMGLQGDYDFLEGLIWLNNCDHVRRIYDNWIRKVDTPFTKMMSLPKMTTDVQVQWFRDELKILKEALEKHLGITISDEKLWKAIKLHNQTRRLLRQLYELRKKDNPPITGAEALAVVVASTAMPREPFNQMLKELLQELSDAEGIKDYRARLMIVAGILDDPAFIKVIEEQGGLVVTDSMCFGTRIIWNEVDEKSNDPLAALARYYIQDKPACPRMFDTQPQRSKFVIDMVKEFKVDGVIGERMIFCDLWTGENFMLGGDLKEEGIPFLKLDREYIMAGAGQLRTRAQAFLESMGR